MNSHQLLVKIYVIIALGLLVVFVHDTEASGHGKKKIVIHVPIHKKIEKHVHTVYKHVHHHHKPIPVIIKEEKIIKEEHHPIIQKEHIHHHEKHEHHHEHKHKEHHEHPVIEELVEEEHIHHHHNYEHKDDESERR